MPTDANPEHRPPLLPHPAGPPGGGCIVDAVTQVMRINRDRIQPPPLSVLSVSHQYISGLARLEDRLLIILDIDRLFDEQSLAIA